jgi:hypothetical protein
MSVRITFVHVVADGDAAISAALGLLTQAIAGQSVTLDAPATSERQSLPAPKPRLTRKALTKAGTPDDAILAALKFRPLRVAELADALCTDKRDVRAALPRLYSKLARLVRDGQVKKVGKAYAVK